jgi:hypothetical protein
MEDYLNHALLVIDEAERQLWRNHALLVIDEEEKQLWGCSLTTFMTLMPSLPAVIMPELLGMITRNRNCFVNRAVCCKFLLVLIMRSQQNLHDCP